MSDNENGSSFDPVMAIALGPSFGMLGGLVLGTTVIDNLGLAITVGTSIGLMIGVVIYALLQDPEEP